jgi:hypothetical protein
MCDFAIKRATINNNPISRQRGDIIEVAEDGTFDNCKSMTILKVLGLSLIDAEKFMENVYKEVDGEELIFSDEFNEIKNNVEDYEVNNKDRTLYYGKFVSLPSEDNVKKEVKDPSTGDIIQKDAVVLSGKVLDIDKKSRFRIPTNLMDQWFPGSVRIKTITALEFESLFKDQLIDKAHGDIPVGDTSWRQSELDVLIP